MSDCGRCLLFICWSGCVNLCLIIVVVLFTSGLLVGGLCLLAIALVVV